MPRLSNARCVKAIRDQVVFDNNNSTLQGRRTFIGWGDIPERDRPIGSLSDPSYVDTAIDYWVYSYETPIAWVFKDGTIHVPPLQGHDRDMPSASTQTHRALLLEALLAGKSLRLEPAGLGSIREVLS